MSKPKFQTEWEEIDDEYQQLQVTENNKNEYVFGGRLLAVRSVPWMLLTAGMLVCQALFLIRHSFSIEILSNCTVVVSNVLYQEWNILHWTFITFITFYFTVTLACFSR